MQVAVVGATGSIGRPLADELERRGHDVRRLSRRSPSHPVDLGTGSGLDRALSGCEVVIDAANGGPAPGPARAVLIDGGRRLLAAAAAAGVGHHVCVSIVGIERVPIPYYRVKVEQEELVAASGLPFSIVRATQFHSLIAALFGATSRFGLLPGGGARLQPIDPLEAAVGIADAAEREPAGAKSTVAGPEVHELGGLARIWRASGRRGLPPLPIPLPPGLGRPLRAGALCEPDPDHRGRRGFAEWLEREPVG